jgi:flagellar basal-body rod protein FlgF
MDRMIFTSMTGAKAMLQRQETLANNLANANTAGFRAETVAFRAVPLQGQGATTRVFALDSTTGFNDATGPIQQTGRNLDVAVRGDGWIAVQGPDGNEAYTRNGQFELGADGVLQTRNGLLVAGDGGPITVPPGSEVSIGSDGTVSVRAANGSITGAGRLKLVSVPEGDKLVKGTDGLFRAASGDPLPADENVRVADGAIEGSNVNIVETMVGMISLARQFEAQMKLMQTAETNERQAAQLLSNQ